MLPSNERVKDVSVTRSQEILGLLAEQGYRMTGPRRTIVEHVVTRLDSFSAQDVLDHLDPDPPIGRATIFRTLDLLAEHGLLHRIPSDDDARLYAVCVDHEHHHLFRCTECGTIQVIEAPAIEIDIERLGEKYGFEVMDHVLDLELLGRCATCRADRPS